MLGFILSIIAFFVVVFFLNRYLDGLGVDKTFFRRFLVGLAATMISIGVSWSTDKLDGNSVLPLSNLPLIDILDGKGGTIKLLKLL